MKDFSEWPDCGGGHISGGLTGSSLAVCAYLVNECNVSLISHKSNLKVVTSF